MVIFFCGNNVCFCGECIKALVSWCKGKGANIAAVKWDCSFELVLPCEQNVVVFCDAGMAVIMPFLFRHGLTASNAGERATGLGHQGHSTSLGWCGHGPSLGHLPIAI